MADLEERLGNPVVDKAGEVKAPEPVAPAKPEEPPAPAPPVEVKPEPETPPSKYAGKSQEELARMLEEQERYFGRLGNELGDTRKQAEYWRQQAVAAQAAKETPEARPKGAAWDWQRFQDKPAETVAEIVERQLVEQERAREEREFVREYNRGKSLAMKERPGLFKDREQQVEQLIVNGRRGGFVSSATVGDPETWYYAAGLLKMKESDFNIGGGVNPVAPSQTERPVARKAAPEETKEPVEFDDKVQAMYKGLGFSAERAAEIVRGEPRRKK